MATTRWRRLLRQVRPRVLISTLLLLLLFWNLLPYDNPIRLSLRFNTRRFAAYIASPLASERWLYQPSPFPVNWSTDVAVILKTGYGTRERAAAWIDALPDGIALENVLVVADFASQAGQTLESLPVHDVLSSTYLPTQLSHPRIQKFSQLSGAISAGENRLALNLSRSFGWELDALKFIPSLELAYMKMPSQKWFILVDDDTYLIQSSLDLILGHLDSSVPYYLGNVVGDFRRRFAHGGSSIVLSRATIHRLFSENGRAVSKAHVNALSETWGDRLLADTLMHIGIYIEEGYRRFFNGEQPLVSKLREDRLCSPVATFHRLSTTEMREVGDTFRKTADPILWIDLWDIYKAPSLELHSTDPFRRDWDHVGNLDEHTTTVPDVTTSHKCHQLCHHGSWTCLAWTWEEATSLCHMSPWMIVGTEARGKTSGLNVPRVRRIADMCH